MCVVHRACIFCDLEVTESVIYTFCKTMNAMNLVTKSDVAEHLFIIMTKENHKFITEKKKRRYKTLTRRHIFQSFNNNNEHRVTVQHLSHKKLKSSYLSSIRNEKVLVIKTRNPLLCKSLRFAQIRTYTERRFVIKSVM